MQTLDTLKVYLLAKELRKEGYGRYHYQENIQFCRMARGSLWETYDHLSSALDEEYISEECFYEFKVKQEYLLEKINRYIAYLKRRKQEG